MSKPTLIQSYTRILSSWPKDPLRPKVAFQSLIQHRLNALESHSPSSSSSNPSSSPSPSQSRQSSSSSSSSSPSDSNQGGKGKDGHSPATTPVADISTGKGSLASHTSSPVSNHATSTSHSESRPTSLGSDTNPPQKTSRPGPYPTKNPEPNPAKQTPTTNDPSPSTENAKADKANILGRANGTASEKSEWEQVKFLDALLENRYQKKFAVSASFYKPALRPSYYDDLVAEIQAAPERGWLQGWLARWRDWVRFT